VRKTSSKPGGDERWRISRTGSPERAERGGNSSERSRPTIQRIRAGRLRSATGAFHCRAVVIKV